MAKAEACASVLLVIESVRNLVRLSREGSLSPDNFVTLDHGQAKAAAEFGLPVTV